MKRFQVIGAGLFAVSALAAAPAHAEEWTRKSFVLPRSSFEITGDPARPTMSTVNTSDDAFAKPVTIAPHFYWGATGSLTLGISHQTGLCLNECDRVYDDVGFDMMLFLVGSRKFELDLHVGAPVSSFDPFTIGGQVGVLGRVNIGAVTALVFDPSLYIGFNRRDEGNREYLNLPFWFYFQANDVIVPFVGSAVADGPLDDLYDDFALPLEGGILFDVAQDVDVGFSLRFPRLIGSDGTGKISNLSFLGRFRF